MHQLPFELVAGGAIALLVLVVVFIPKCTVRITAQCKERATQEDISDRQLNYACRGAERFGWGLLGTFMWKSPDGTYWVKFARTIDNPKVDEAGRPIVVAFTCGRILPNTFRLRERHTVSRDGRSIK